MRLLERLPGGVTRDDNARVGKTRLGIISTKFLGTNQDVQFWVAQLLMALGRWISRSPAPDGSLQAVVLFDESEGQIDAGRHPCRRVRGAIANVDRVGLDAARWTPGIRPGQLLVVTRPAGPSDQLKALTRGDVRAALRFPLT